jgi:putative DeoR family transcriptional regulator (stage III sporulation protein D)
MSNTIKQKYSHRGFFFMKRIVTHNLPVMGNSSTVKLSIEERSVELAHYIIESKDTVRGAAKKFGISKSTVHTEVTLKNGRNKRQPIPESIEIKKVFLAEKNPVVRLVFVIK